MPITTPTMLETDTLSIRELNDILRPEIEQLDADGFEYFSITSSVLYNRDAQTLDRAHKPIGRYNWLACFPVTGGSEGHDVHVDRFYLAQAFDEEFTREPIFLVKTFGGWERACEIAAYLGARLGA